MRLIRVGATGTPEHRVSKGTFTVGSARDNDLVLPFASISRYHATIRRRLGRYVLDNLNSTNGVIVNGVKVNNSVTLRPGDDLRFANVRFVVRRDRGFYAAGDRDTFRTFRHRVHFNPVN